MKINDLGNKAVVVKATHAEIKGLSNLLKVKAENPRYSKAFRDKKWDGYYKLFDSRSKSFPAGLLDIVKRKDPKLIIETNTQRKCPINIDNIYGFAGDKPRKYQIAAVKTAFENRRGIIEVPTGGGKSFIIAMMCAVVDGTVMVVVPTKKLLTQTVEVLEKKLGEPIGVVGDGRYELERITVGIYKSVDMLSDEELQFNCLIVDECHHTSADTYKSICSRSMAYYRYGLSADSLDQHNVKAEKKHKRALIIGSLGPILHLTTNKELKDEGFLASAIVKFVRVKSDEVSTSPVRNGNYCTKDYVEAYCNEYCDNPYLTDAVKNICDTAFADQILIIVKHIHHGRELLLNIKGAEFVHGMLPIKEIDDAIKRFNSGDLQILIGSPIFNEGIDVPNVDILINAAGDVAATKQRIGRGLRKKSGKENKVIVYDFITGKNVYMNNHVDKRIRIYRKEGHSVELPKG